MKSPKFLQKIKEKIGGKISAKLSKLSYRQFFFIIAVVCSIVFLVLLFILPDGKSTETAKQKQQQVKPKVETVKVVTANRDIPPRTILREDMLVTTEIPSNLLPEGYVTDSKQAINLPAAVALQKGDVLTTKKFYADIRMAGFPGKIPDDCRAISIAISDVTGVAGFAKPGDYVDIMAVSGRRGSRSATTGSIILQNVLLLGINKSAKVEQHNTTTTSKDGKQQSQGDGKTEEGSSDGKDKDKKKEAAEPGSTASAQAMANATVAVTPADALKLAVASQKGTLYLALRPVVPKEAIVLDTEYVLEEGGDEEESNDRTSYTEPAPAPTTVPAASVPLPTGDVPAQVPQVSTPPLPGSGEEVTVEVIRGTQTQSTTVRSE